MVVARWLRLVGDDLRLYMAAAVKRFPRYQIT